MSHSKLDPQNQNHIFYFCHTLHEWAQYYWAVLKHGSTEALLILNELLGKAAPSTEFRAPLKRCPGVVSQPRLISRYRGGWHSLFPRNRPLAPMTQRSVRHALILTAKLWTLLSQPCFWSVSAFPLLRLFALKPVSGLRYHLINLTRDFDFLV